MATTKKATPIRKTATQLREENEKLQKLLDTGCRCAMCKKVKDQETKFYYDTDPLMGGSSFTRICRECAKAIACRRDKNGADHEPTKESVQLALYYLNKPFLESVWNASIQESENLVTGKTKNNVWSSYIKNIQMVQYVGMGFKDSDMFKDKPIKYEDELTEQDIIDSHQGQDTYDSYLKNKADVVRLLDYDPFELESVNDQPFLYSQLLGLLDSNGEGNDDMMRTSSAISIVRGFLQSSKIDDTIAKLMSDINNIEKNSATIKSLQDSKSKITGMIKDLAAESCISLAHTKNNLKGENTWTGKIKKIKDLNLRDGQVNGFDIGTCRGMQQVLDLSNASILKQLNLDESEWSDMVAELRQVRTDLENQIAQYREVNRILLQENLDLKDYLEEKNIDININLRDLKEVYSPFASLGESADDESEVETDESSDSTL